MGLFGPPNIKKLEDKRDVLGLIKALDYEKEYIRFEAAGALGRIGDASAVEPLIAVLKDDDRGMRYFAAEALGEIGAQLEDADLRTRVVEPLIAALKDEHKQVREGAARGLGKIGDARAAGPLVTALTYGYDFEQQDVRAAVVEALGKIGTPAVEALGAALAQEQTGTSDEDYKMYRVRCVAAAEALGKIGKISAPALEPLVAALKNSDKDVRREAAEALGKIGAPAIGPLVAALKDEERYAREAAASLLNQLGWKPNRDENGARYWIARSQWDECVTLGAPAVELLIAALKEVDFYGRMNPQALGALGEVGARLEDAALRARAMEPLIAALKDRDKDVRKAAAQALGKIGDPRAVEPLIPALSDKDNDVRSVTAEALGNIGAQLQDATLRTRVVEQLIEALKESGVRHKAAVALGKIGDTRAVGPLIASLKDGFWYRQSPEEVEALAQIGIPAVKPLVVALKDSNQQVRCLAAEALCKISDAHAIEPPIARLEDIVEPLIDLLEDDYGERRRASAKNLVKLYQSGELDMRLKQRILIYKQKMSERHIDKKYEGSCDTSGGHTDIGIGIEL